METLLPGTEVLVRGLHWEVVDVAPAGEETRYLLRCLQGALRGKEVNFLSPFEKIEAIARDLDVKNPGRLAEWRLYHEAFLLEQALGAGALLAAQPGRLKVAAYQLVPVMRALRLTRARLLLADGVGLGKTIQAGLVMAELIARRRAHRILIVTPPGPLLKQWQTEMRLRFGLGFRELDRDALQEIRHGAELGANPFDHVALAIVSIDFVKQEHVLLSLERTQYDLVVIDEAHHCMSLGVEGDRDDSLRRRLAEVLARQADNLLLLTATPHDGYDAHFASLIQLLDPSLVDGRGALRGEGYRQHVIRRLKRHVRDEQGQELFPPRKVEPRRIVFGPSTHPKFSALQEALIALVAPQLRRALKSRRYRDVLAFVALLKRSVSTVAACEQTIAAIVGRLGEVAAKGQEAQEDRKQRLRTLAEYRRRLERFGVLSTREEREHQALQAEDMAAELAKAEDLGAFFEKVEALKRESRRERDRLARGDRLREGLARLRELAEAARTDDPKLAALVSTLEEIRRAEPDGNVLVYTEYTDSQEVAVAALSAAVESGRLVGEIVSLSGDDDDKTREHVTDKFRREGPLVLVSTDATAEGLNLHDRCHHLIHLELPYNPNRLEQRNGRIDRFGQKLPPTVRYLYLAGTFEERLLARLVQKFEKQRERLTFVPDTLGSLTLDSDVVTRGLIEGLASEEGTLFSEAPPFEFTSGTEEDTASAPYREMLQEIDRAIQGFERETRNHGWLGEVGLNADAKGVADALEARQRGGRHGVVDLLPFVTGAVVADSDRRHVTKRSDGVWEITLPPAWTHGLDQLPGYNAEKRLLRLTTEVELVEDSQGQPVGYLGRAHPIVRRALDRVRHVQLAGGGSRLDRRVSVGIADGDAPEILATFLARIQSAAGREFERVLAVRVARGSAPLVLSDHTQWEPLTRPERAVFVERTWSAWFSGWADAAREHAREAAAAAFRGLADVLLAEHEASLQHEQRQLDGWLRSRADELCGPQGLGTRDLFSGQVDAPAWTYLEVPAERLAAFATDRDVHVNRRREAEVVLNLDQRRRAELDRRRRLDPPSIAPLGLLLLVPREATQ